MEAASQSSEHITATAEEVENGQMELPLDERREMAVAATYLQHNYTLPNGDKDTAAVRSQVFDLLSEAIVETKADRVEKAITRASLTTRVFPELPDREHWGDQDDPTLAELVYKTIDQQVWNAAKPDHSGPIQKQIGNLGYVLCRTKVGKDGIDAAYITKDLNCLLEDFHGPLAAKAKKAADDLGRNLGMVMDRLPEHSRPLSRAYQRDMKTALNAGATQFAPALTAATEQNGTEQDEE